MAGTALLPARNRVQSPFQECFDTLGEAHNEDVYGAIERLVLERGHPPNHSVEYAMNKRTIRILDELT